MEDLVSVRRNLGQRENGDTRFGCLGLQILSQAHCFCAHPSLVWQRLEVQAGPLPRHKEQRNK